MVKSRQRRRPAARSRARSRSRAPLVDFDAIEALARDLPRVERGMAWGTDALKVDGQMFACVPTHRSSEPGSLAVRVAFADRDELIAHQPDTFYVKEHYLDYPCVLVRLQHIHPDALRGLLVMGWQFVTANRAKRKRRRRS